MRGAESISTSVRRSSLLVSPVYLHYIHSPPSLFPPPLYSLLLLSRSPACSVANPSDIWAAFTTHPFGQFADISTLTMFADYRVPVILYTLGCLLYSPPLEAHIRALKPLPVGHPWEVQLRGTSIWCVEMIRRQIKRTYPETSGHINAVLIDFYLYDTAKDMEKEGKVAIPCHRTRSIWY